MRVYVQREIIGFTYERGCAISPCSISTVMARLAFSSADGVEAVTTRASSAGLSLDEHRKMTLQLHWRSAAVEHDTPST